MKKKSITVSCLMSVYYREDAACLRKAIESIVCQTVLPNEFIIVKDGPLTPTLDAVLEEYETKYAWIHVIPLEKNMGLGKALNEGMNYCQYNFVARMDSDDFSVPERFEHQLAYLEKHPECDVLGSYIMEYDEDLENPISRREVPLDSQMISSFLKKRNPMNHVTVVMRKEAVLEAGGYQDCPYFEDYYLWARMLKHQFSFANIPEDLVFVRAGERMSNRRGGFTYIKNIMTFESRLRKLGFINSWEYFENVLVRSMISFVPNKVRYQLYQKKLRKKDA